MSDFRFAGRWLNDRRVVALAGDDFKAFILAGAGMVENRTDGRISADDFEFIPRFNCPSVPRLVAAGLWIVDGDGWLMVDYVGTQTSRAEFEVLENARRREREKKARQRTTKREGDVSPGTVPGDYTGKDRTGKDRQGSHPLRDEISAGHCDECGSTTAGRHYATCTQAQTYEPVTNWATAAIPRDEPVAAGYVEDEVPW